jgi:hypothetical protein
VAFVSLGLISIRAVLMGHPAPWPDYVALASIAGTLVLLRLRSGWHSALSWFILALLYLDAAEGLFPWHPETITPTHLLLPLLVISIFGSAFLSAAVWHFHRILIRALSETGRVRIQIWNPGTEIPDDVLQVSS